MTIHYIGDSTVAFNTIHTYPQTGLSQGLSWYVRPGVLIHSYAKNGRSTKSFLDEGRFREVRENMKPGDLLLIQFGHNDEKPDPARGTDPETTFPQNLRTFIQGAREKGALPVLLTPIARRQFDASGRFLPGSHGAYPAAMKTLGAAEGVPVIDMTAQTEAFLAELGDEASKPLFVWPVDNTHLKVEGAIRLAAFIAQGLRELGRPYCAVLATPNHGAGGLAPAADVL